MRISSISASKCELPYTSRHDFRLRIESFLMQACAAGLRVGIETGTSSDAILMRSGDGAPIDDITHLVPGRDDLPGPSIAATLTRRRSTHAGLMLTAPPVRKQNLPPPASSNRSASIAVRSALPARRHCSPRSTAR
jgi:hypothetical protein